MIVQIKINGEKPDWCIVELQGKVDGRERGVALDDLPLGELSLNNNGEPVLIIGSSKLVGKFITLKKPFVIISYDENEQPLTTMALDETDGYDANWECVGIVRRKILFKTRPQPVVSAVPK